MVPFRLGCKMTTIYSQTRDRDLVLACQRRDPVAFEELVNRHQKSVYTLLFQLAPDWSDINELAQEVFVRSWRSINNLRNPASFRFWLTQIVTDLFYEELRKRPRRLHAVSLPVDEAEEKIEQNSSESPAFSEGFNENHLKDATGEEIRSAMSKLPEQFRTALVLKELEGLNYEEIAILSKTESGTVKSRIAQARIKLQKTLADRIKAYQD
jgi:RNA polymerase sigma-70 factor, ECF subfamily